MNGYVINKSPLWTRAMKREVRPNGKVSIKDLYAQYGKKHNLQEGEEFIDWLKSVKLKGSVFEVVIDDNYIDNMEGVNVGANMTTPIVANSKLSAEEVAMLTVRPAREIVPTITDLKILKAALKHAGNLANKDNVCRIIKKRVQELEQYV